MVLTLQSLLQNVGNELQEPTSAIHKAGKSKRQQLTNLIEDCNTDLGDLERYLLQYRSLQSAKPRFRDRLRFGIKPISQIRLKLSQHTDGLNLFLTHINTSSLGRLEQASDTSAAVLHDIRAKLDDLHRQVELGQKDGAVLDVQSSWADLEKELVGDSVTECDVASNRDSIQEYITTWLKTADHAAEPEQKSELVVAKKRTSSMTPWSPMASFSSTSSSSSQLLAAPQFGNHSREPSYDMWSFSRNCGPPSVVSEVPPSEIVSTVSESVFDSFSCPSSRTTTPDIPDTPSWLPSSSDACLGITSPAVRSNSDAGIESLIDELDAFVLDFSRSSTPTGDEYPRTPENEFPSSEDYMIKDRTPKAARQAPVKRRVISRTLPLTLEEAFSGGCKTKRIRGRLQAQRNDKDELELCESTIEVHYPAGAKAGLLIKVPDVGVDVKGVPQDLHFTVELKPHKTFKREGDELVATVKISLLESLCGWNKTIRTIDGKKISIERSDVTAPSWSQSYAGLGMPQDGMAGKRSNMIVKVDVEYPESISPYQDKIFKQLLAPKRDLSPRMERMLADGHS
ncbi:hypothetical protein KJ359_002019 [Pestalotiopsis sp. 9143b]|nr:hypothetical protein KJ359_002019 [Pestalotiopsis sp. 9143b]